MDKKIIGINDDAHQIEIPDHYDIVLYAKSVDPKIKKLIDKLINV